MSTNPDNLVKISLVESEISLLQAIAKREKVTAVKRKPPGFQKGGLINSIVSVMVSFAFAHSKEYI